MPNAPCRAATLGLAIALPLYGVDSLDELYEDAGTDYCDGGAPSAPLSDPCVCETEVNCDY